MIIQTDEKSVTLTPFGSLALNGVANVSRDPADYFDQGLTAAHLAVAARLLIQCSEPQFS